MRLNTKPEPIVVYDRDQEEFFLKVGTFITTNAELADNILSETRWNMDHAVNKGVRFAMYPINSEGEVIDDECPGRRFITVGPQGTKVNILSRAIKEATYTGFANNGGFNRKLETTRRKLSNYGIEIQQIGGDVEVSFEILVRIDNDFDGLVRIDCGRDSDIYGGIIYESKTPPPVETLVTDIINHLNNVAPSICTGKLLINFEPYVKDDKLDYGNLRDLVKNYRGFKSSDWEIIEDK